MKVHVCSRSGRLSFHWLIANLVGDFCFKASVAELVVIVFINDVLLPSHHCAIHLIYPKILSCKCMSIKLVRLTRSNSFFFFRMISSSDRAELYSGTLPYAPAFHPAIPLPRRHPPPLAQRERSTSAPNVCYNMVTSSGMDASLEDWSRVKAHNLAGTGKLACLFYVQPSILEALPFPFDCSASHFT